MSKTHSILLKKVKIYDRQSKQHLKLRDVYIRNGVIEDIGRNLSYKADQVVSIPNLCISAGWFDIGAQCGEPGMEHRETLESLSLAAQKGGYTSVAVFPNTYPELDNKSMIDYIYSQSRGLGTQMLPIGAVSKNCKGKELAEFIDMHHAGAVAFSDGQVSIDHAGLMTKSLQYALTTNKTIINHPSSCDLLHHSYINEGSVSTAMGIKGEPSIAEHLMLNRDIKLAGYTDGALVTHLISTSESLKLVTDARKNQPHLKMTVSAMHLVHNEESVIDFDPNYKQSPPLRREADRKKLVAGCQKEVIDAIVSNHTPLDTESKDLEFAYSDPGTIGLETCFALLNTELSKKLTTEVIVHYLSQRNRTCLNIEIPHITIGQSAELTLFDPGQKWIFTLNDIGSMSKNTPYLNNEFVGRVYGTIRNNIIIVNY